MSVDWSLVVAFLALVVSGVSIWVSWWLHTRARVLKLLEESRRSVEESATYTELLARFEIANDFPAAYPPSDDSFARALRHCIESRRIYARVKNHLSVEARRHLDELVAALNLDSAAGSAEAGFDLLQKQALFLDALEKELDKAAHPGMKLGPGRLGEDSGP